MSKVKEVVTYSELARRVGDCVLMNKITEVDPEMLYEGIENGSLYQECNFDDDKYCETHECQMTELLDGEECSFYYDEVPEIYQYYAITSGGADYLKAVSDELVFYSEKLDTYFWGITHFGTSWDSVETELHEREGL